MCGMVELRAVHSIDDHQFTASVHGGDRVMPPVWTHNERIVNARRRSLLAGSKQRFLDVRSQGSPRCGLTRHRRIRRAGRIYSAARGSGHRGGYGRRDCPAGIRRRRLAEHEGQRGPRRQDDLLTHGDRGHTRRRIRVMQPAEGRAHRAHGPACGALRGSGHAGGAARDRNRLAVDGYRRELRGIARSTLRQRDGRD